MRSNKACARCRCGTIPHELRYDPWVAEGHRDVEDGAEGVDRPVDVLADEGDLAEADARHGSKQRGSLAAVTAVRTLSNFSWICFGGLLERVCFETRAVSARLRALTHGREDRSRQPRLGDLVVP